MLKVDKVITARVSGICEIIEKQITVNKEYNDVIIRRTKEIPTVKPKHKIMINYDGTPIIEGGN